MTSSLSFTDARYAIPASEYIETHPQVSWFGLINRARLDFSWFTVTFSPLPNQPTISGSFFPLVIVKHLKEIYSIGSLGEGRAGNYRFIFNPIYRALT